MEAQMKETKNYIDLSIKDIGKFTKIATTHDLVFARNIYFMR